MAEILQIAADLFSERSYSNTTIKDIADAAGVLPGSLYHHFDSKAAIAVALLDAFVDDLTTVVEDDRRRQTDDGPEQRIRTLTRALAACSSRHRAAVQLRAYEAPSTDSAQMSAALRTRIPAFSELWTERIDALTTLPHRPELNLPLLRYTFQFLSLNAGRLPDDPYAYADRSCDVLLHGLLMHEYPDEELADSPAHRAVQKVVRAWSEERRARSSDLRAPIIDAARQQFALRGYEATTIRDIAAVAEVPMGSLYRRVSSKEKLRDEILGIYSASLTAGVAAALDTPQTTVPQALDALAQLLVAAARMWKAENQIARLEWRDASGGRNAAQIAESTARQQRLEAVVRQGQHEGSLTSAIASADIAALLRSVFWLPFQDQNKCSQAQARQFLRVSVLRGSLLG